MTVLRARLGHLVLTWLFALALAAAPWLGAAHAGVMSGGSTGAAQMQVAMTGHDCADMDGSASLEAMPDQAPGSPSSHGKSAPSCAEMCRMACHAPVILTTTFFLPSGAREIPEDRPMLTLEALEPDVQVPPPRALC